MDMNAIASAFNGGGHVHSAGFVCEGSSLQEIETKLINDIRKKL